MAEAKERGLRLLACQFLTLEANTVLVKRIDVIEYLCDAAPYLHSGIADCPDNEPRWRLVFV